MIGRRAAIAKGAASMFGLGRLQPSRFPYSDRPQSPGAGPGQVNVFRGRLVTVSGPNGGVFVYFPAPGAGNLVSSDTGQSGTDPYGNAYVGPGLTTYISTGVGSAMIALQHKGNQLFSLTATSPAGPYLPGGDITFIPGGQLFIENGGSGSGITLNPNGGTPVTVQGNFAVTLAATMTGGTAASPTTITTDTRHLATMINGWTGTLYYWRNPDDTISCAGSVNPAASTGTICATIPYTPPVAFDFAVAPHTSVPPTQGVFSRLATTGDVNLINSTVGSGQMGVAIMGVPLF